MFSTITLNAIISKSFSKDTAFLCIFFHMEYGLFSLPVILHFIFASKLSWLVNFLIISSKRLFWFFLKSLISCSISDLSCGNNASKHKSSNSSFNLYIPILSANGTYIINVSLAILSLLSLSFIPDKVDILFNLSDNFIIKILISFEVDKINFLKFSAFFSVLDWNLTLWIFVKPSTK